ncbi:hypothetical protein FPQ18DRAFT_14495 [Pyronema domesticum]|uniref:Similar to Putative polysaccharide deacetylase yheN acc. no. O07596 n=1 Tax=Pyronema omphalodes (strain CBS 100304) TaxID=1076935 RepID=U4L9E3_PYROM|nr:hypothetical protein FPQ18DRAFT_14495 [Pyronema domesticum]CCX15042.1 Similar to Putative polysaccharide deacetylase yheN; acc. no. O07596 [Pyronema omphalodes CBS 100304]
MLSPLFLLSLVGLSTQLVIDKFASPDSNALGNWHGCDEGDGITCTFGSGKLTVKATDTDYSFYTQLNGGCQDVTGMNSQYLHVKISGSSDFSIALQQNNPSCDETLSPYPQTWDIVYAPDYTVNGDIYVPLSHFNINKQKAVGFAFKAFRSTTATTFSLVEIVTSLPSGRTVPAKKPTGPLIFQCTRPNSIAFGIDDGVPELAQRTMQIIKDAGIKVTFFTVGSALTDPEGNFTAIYKEALDRGHQVALHSMTHPKLEGLIPASKIDQEFQQSLSTVQQKLGSRVSTKYFRAPYGTDGALTRQKLETAVGGGSRVINWSIDIEDWLWGESSTPEKQVEAVKRDIARGGNLFVSHYLYPSTVEYFPEFIRLAKATGKQIMRVDQCLEDPNAPPL